MGPSDTLATEIGHNNGHDNGNGYVCKPKNTFIYKWFINH